MSYPSAAATSAAAATTGPSPVTGAMASSTSAISSSVAPAARARPVLHSRRCYRQQRRGLGIQEACPVQAKVEPGRVFDEAFVDHRQPAQGLLEFRCLA